MLIGIVMWEINQSKKSYIILSNWTLIEPGSITEANMTQSQIHSLSAVIRHQHHSVRH